MAVKGPDAKLVLKLDTCEDDVFCITPDGSGLYTGHYTLVKRWKQDGSLTHSIQLPVQGEVTCISSTPTKLAISTGTSILLYDPRNLTTPIETCSHNKDEINQICINPSDNFLISCDDTGAILALDVSTNRLKLYRTCHNGTHTNICSTVAFHPRKNWEIISGGLDCHMILWDFSRGKVLYSLNVQDAISEQDTERTTYLVNPPMVHCICTIDRLPLVAAGLENGMMLLCDIDKSSIDVICTRQFHTKGIASITSFKISDSIQGDEQYVIITGGNDGKLVWHKLVKNSSSLDVVPNKPKANTFLILKEPLAVFDHGSKINWITKISNDTNIVGVADQTSNVTLYSLLD